MGRGKEFGFYFKCKTKALQHLAQGDNLIRFKRKKIFFLTLCVEQMEEEKVQKPRLLLEAYCRLSEWG